MEEPLDICGKALSQVGIRSVWFHQYLSVGMLCAGQHNQHCRYEIERDVDCEVFQSFSKTSLDEVYFSLLQLL